MFIKPKDEKTIVRNPTTGILVPISGIKVDDNDSYWLRRLRDGDVVKVADVKAKGDTAK